VEGRLTRPNGPRYSGDATLYSFRLDQLIAELPEMLLDGKVTFDIGGTAVENLNGRISARLPRTEIRGVAFDNAYAALTLADGAARIDTLRSDSPREYRAGGIADRHRLVRGPQRLDHG
jgi:hypothetical protein